ncbi:MAG: hypothetical protein B7X99_15180, partial [Rhizobiales bacterium 17-65-6]
TVEIARALSLNVKVLIMDEPTASLSAHEVARLLGIARALKAKGVAVIYISHRLDEIFEVADRVTVIRDGQHISTRPIAEVTPDGMVREMVGRAISSFAVKTEGNPHGASVLRLEGLGRAGVFRGISFDLAAGEVLCLAGLVGALALTHALWEPFCIACLMQVYFGAIAGQRPDPDWRARLDGASAKFAALGRRAVDAAA